MSRRFLPVIFERNNSFEPALLVHHETEMVLASLHLTQTCSSRACLPKQGRLHDVFQTKGFGMEQVWHTSLLGQIPITVIYGFAINRKT